jgi:hypothetical protein
LTDRSIFNQSIDQPTDRIFGYTRTHMHPPPNTDLGCHDAVVLRPWVQRAGLVDDLDTAAASAAVGPPVLIGAGSHHGCSCPCSCWYRADPSGGGGGCGGASASGSEERQEQEEHQQQGRRRGHISALFRERASERASSNRAEEAACGCLYVCGGFESCAFLLSMLVVLVVVGGGETPLGPVQRFTSRRGGRARGADECLGGRAAATHTPSPPQSTVPEALRLCAIDRPWESIDRSSLKVGRCI